MKKKSNNEIHEEILSCGCGHCAKKRENRELNNNATFLREYYFQIIRIVLSLIFFIAGFFVEEILSLIFFIFSAFIVGYDLIKVFLYGVIKLKFFDENTLMLIASITAFMLGEFFEGALIVLLFFIGEFLEKIATDNSRKKIAGLSTLKSYIVHHITREGLNDVSPEEVEIGSLIEVRSGEMVPIDGVLIGTTSDFDMKAITGESNYVSVRNGDTVFSGAINVGNPVLIRTVKQYKDSTVEKIISMVEGSLSKKAKSQKFISSFARCYTPIIFGVSILIATIPPIFDQMHFVKWIYKALSFLVISCPCALVISVPLSFFVAIGCLARNGIMVKGSSYIEALTKIDTVIFDKTGTITYGNFIIERIEALNGFTENQILNYAVGLESKSNHPIAKAIALNKPTNIVEFKNVKELRGKGICGENDEKLISIGNERLMNDFGVEVKDDFAGTVLYVCVDSVLVGKIFISDQVKENVSMAIKALRKQGVNNTIILSGDRETIVNKVSSIVGVDYSCAQLLPDEKVDKLKQIKDSTGKKVMFVGDGINDSPSLALADVGVAMGGLGSEIATSSADIVIMDDNLEKLSIALKHSRKTKRTILLNIIGSLTVKFSIMFLSLIISMPVYLAMLADVGVMLLAVCFSLRLGNLSK